MQAMAFGSSGNTDPQLSQEHDIVNSCERTRADRFSAKDKGGEKPDMFLNTDLNDLPEVFMADNNDGQSSRSAVDISHLDMTDIYETAEITGLEGSSNQFSVANSMLFANSSIPTMSLTSPIVSSLNCQKSVSSCALVCSETMLNDRKVNDHDRNGPCSSEDLKVYRTEPAMTYIFGCDEVSAQGASLQSSPIRENISIPVSCNSELDNLLAQDHVKMTSVLNTNLSENTSAFVRPLKVEPCPITDILNSFEIRDTCKEVNDLITSVVNCGATSAMVTDLNKINEKISCREINRKENDSSKNVIFGNSFCTQKDNNYSSGNQSVPRGSFLVTSCIAASEDIKSTACIQNKQFESTSENDIGGSRNVTRRNSVVNSSENGADDNVCENSNVFMVENSSFLEMKSELSYDDNDFKDSSITMTPSQTLLRDSFFKVTVLEDGTYEIVDDDDDQVEDAESYIDFIIS